MPPLVQPTPDSPSVLIVDDHAPNLLALEAVLAPLRVRVVPATSGKEALARFSEEEFALVLLDHQMPGMDGTETAARMHGARTEGRTPIIMITAYVPERDALLRAYSYGVVDFLQKPYPPEVLTTKVTVFVDLYRQREKLRLYEEALRESFQQRLVAIVSHDLRTPLAAILLTAERGLRGAEAEAHSRKLFTRIQSAAHRASRLVDDLLDYTHVLNGTRLPIKAQRCCLVELAREVVQELEQAHPECQFLLEHEEETVSGSWDPARLAQVVTNLAVNAVTYGGNTPIVLRVVADAESAELQVHNSGEPIAPDSIPRLFEPMVRAANTRGPGNLGLGLFIVSEVVKAHGGTVEVSSSKELGTTFSVRLPRQSAPDASGELGANSLSANGLRSRP